MIRFPTPAARLVLLATLVTVAMPSTGVASSIEELRISSGDVVLGGLLRLPAGTPPHPAVVLLAGSRATAKEDERFARVAAAFLAMGFAVLTTDSRGTGSSGGDFALASFETLAADAAAAIAALRSRDDIRDGGVGLWGMSQGATWVGPLAADRADAAFLVAASGPLVTPEEQTHRFLAARLRGAGLHSSTVERIEDTRRAIWSYYASGEGHERVAASLAALREEPWFADAGLPREVRAPDALAALPPALRTFLAQKDFDPLEALSRIDLPVLAIYEAGDDHLPQAAQLELLRARPKKGPPIDVVVAAEGTESDAASWAAEQVGAPVTRSQ